VDHHCDLAFEEAELPGHIRIIDLLHPLDLQKMVPAAQCPQLGPAPFSGLEADLLRIGSGHAPALLAVGEVCLKAVALLHRPPGPGDEGLG